MENTDLPNHAIVTDALEYYDTNSEKYKTIFKNVHYVSFTNNKSDASHNIIQLFDDDKKLMLSSKYEIIGMFIPKNKTWIWGWSIPFLRKNMTTIIRKILNYGVELDPSVYIKPELITSRFHITNETQLDIHMAVATFLSKKQAVYKFYDDSERYNFDSKTHIDVKNISDDYVVYYLFILDQ